MRYRVPVRNIDGAGLEFHLEWPGRSAPVPFLNIIQK